MKRSLKNALKLICASIAIMATIGVVTNANAQSARVKAGQAALEEKDYTSAKDKFQKSCEANEGDACFLLGHMYYMGNGMDPSDDDALKFFKMACGLNNGTGCTHLANMYDKGYGVDINPTKAKELYTKGCNLGDHEGCDAIGRK